MDPVTLILTILAPTGIFTWLVREGFRLVGLHIENEQAKEAVQLLNEAVEDAVHAVEQTYVKRVKDHGTLNPTQRSQAASIALKLSKRAIGKKTVEALTKVFDLESEADLERIILNKSEAIVSKLKFDPSKIF